jgi:hypothetical protein
MNGSDIVQNVHVPAVERFGQFRANPCPNCGSGWGDLE